jgi:hypothetical protein
MRLFSFRLLLKHPEQDQAVCFAIPDYGKVGSAPLWF